MAHSTEGQQRRGECQGEPDCEPAREPAHTLIPENLRHGRGARTNRVGRFERELREAVDDGWAADTDAPALRTEVRRENAKSIITRNDSPDLSFDRSINP